MSKCYGQCQFSARVAKRTLNNNNSFGRRFNTRNVRFPSNLSQWPTYLIASVDILPFLSKVKNCV